MKNVIERTDLIGFPRGWEAATNAQLSAVGVFPNTMFYSHRIGCMILQCLQSNKGDHFQVGVNGRAEMMRWRRSGAYPHLIVMLQSLNGEIMNFQDIKYVDDKLKDVQPHQGKAPSYEMGRTLTGQGRHPYSDYHWVNENFDPVDRGRAKFQPMRFDPRSTKRAGTFDY